MPLFPKATLEHRSDAVCPRYQGWTRPKKITETKNWGSYWDACIYIYIFMYIYIYICIYDYIHTYIHTCISMYLHIRTYIYMYIYIHTYIYIYMFVVYVCDIDVQWINLDFKP